MSKKLTRHCVFCGERPVGKTNEHVLPQWAIEMTGDPRRECLISTLSPDPSKQIRRFPFKELQFPACDACNNDHATLEGLAKGVVVKLLAKSTVSASELHLLLDWLDKVRVGVWLGIRYLDQNAVPVTPNFYIAHRIGNADRLVCLTLTDAPSLRLTFSGANTVAFRYMPSAFGLTIKGLGMFNVSCDFLLARRLGLPYPEKIPLHPSGAMQISLTAGRERIMRPPFPRAEAAAGTWIYQPMIPATLVVGGHFESLYSSNYVASMMSNPEYGLGRIFIGDEAGGASYYPTEESGAWVPRRRYIDSDDAVLKISKMVLATQLDLLDYLSLDNLELKLRRRARQQRSFARKHLKFANKLLDNPDAESVAALLG